jgi:hypothetical protein
MGVLPMIAVMSGEIRGMERSPVIGGKRAFVLPELLEKLDVGVS